MKEEQHVAERLRRSEAQRGSPARARDECSDLAIACNIESPILASAIDDNHLVTRVLCNRPVRAVLQTGFGWGCKHRSSDNVSTGVRHGAMTRVEIITGPERRRRWSAEQKRAIVAESLAPGAVVTERLGTDKPDQGDSE
jgi:hypothetical protein